jgi:DNA (cytosine-5)-methyltransferase 1
MQNAVISLFSGAMGLDLGLEQADFRVAVALEIDRAAIETIRLNRPNLPIIDKPIAEAPTDEILKKADLKARDVAIVSGGPCCQSFSTVGRRRSISDPKGGLFLDFCRVVREIRPRFFVMENVKGILSAAVRHRPLDLRGPGFPPLAPEEELGSALKVILKELAALRYYVVFGLLNAADFGVGQKRFRVIFMGSRDGEDIHLPKPTHADPAGRNGNRNGLPDWVTLRKTLRAVEPKEWIDFKEPRLELLRLVKPGQNWRHLPLELHEKALGGAFDSWGGRTGFCRRLAWDKTSPALTTAPDGRATTLCHPDEHRPLSVEEYAALQQFPKDWKFAGSVAQKYVQIGNAVPVGLGYSIGKMLRNVMRRRSRTGHIHLCRRGKVVCGDAGLEERLVNRKKTQLHPPRLRKNPDPEAAKEWLKASA